MVHFIRYGSGALFYSGVRCRDRSRRVTPFGHPRINGYVLLHAAYRSLSRPSSSCSSTGIRHGPIFRLTILSFPSAPHSLATLASAVKPWLPSLAHCGHSRFFTFHFATISRGSVSLPLCCQRTSIIFHRNENLIILCTTWHKRERKKRLSNKT